MSCDVVAELDNNQLKVSRVGHVLRDLREGRIPRAGWTARNDRGRRGFSLVELLVVMVIIGLLASLVVFKTRSYLIASKQNAAKVEIAKLVQAIETFYAAHDRYPTNDEGLQVLVTASDAFSDGIINKVPQDPWKQPYQYNNPGENSAFEVICLGADGQEGGEGPDRDISSENLDEQQS